MLEMGYTIDTLSSRGSHGDSTGQSRTNERASKRSPHSSTYLISDYPYHEYRYRPSLGISAMLEITILMSGEMREGTYHRYIYRGVYTRISQSRIISSSFKLRNTSQLAPHNTQSICIVPRSGPSIPIRIHTSTDLAVIYRPIFIFLGYVFRFYSAFVASSLPN